MKEYANNPIVKRSVEFALMIIKYTGALEENRKFVIANQLMKCGTSIGANVLEAQSAESKADFIHKMKIADKEAREARYWLYLCEQSEGFEANKSLTEKLDEIVRLLNAIILSSKK